MDVFHIQTFCTHCLSFTFLLFKDGYTLTHTHTHKCRYPSIPDPMDNDIVIAFSNSEDLIYQVEYEGEEDCEVPGELARLLQQEERAILPHEELLDTINLGTEEYKKEIKVGANIELSVKERLIQLLHDYVEIFAWSYEDMPGLGTDIVVHRLPTKRRLSTSKAKSPPYET